MKHHLGGTHEDIVMCTQCPEEIKKVILWNAKEEGKQWYDFFQKVKVISGSGSMDIKEMILGFLC